MISDEELRRALLEWEEKRLEQLPELEGSDAGLSPGFERKMRRLIERTDHPAGYWLKKGLACLLLAAFLGGGVLAVSGEARAAFFGWTREVYETCFEYRYTGENAAAPGNFVYLPAWIPDGFEVFHESYSVGQVNISYSTQEGGLAHFSYYVNDTVVDLHIVSESCQVRQVFVGEYPADLYLDNIEGENNSLVWTDGQRGVIFAISAPLSGEELIKMGESVAAVACPEAAYLPAWIPGGFELTEEYNLPNGAELYYENEAGQFMQFAYSMDKEGTTVQIAGDNIEVQSVRVGNCSGDLYLDRDEGENSALVWADTERKALFQILAPLSGDELIKMAESVTNVESSEGKSHS